MTSNSIRIVATLFLVFLFFINFIIAMRKLKMHVFNEIMTTESSVISELPVILDVPVRSEILVGPELPVISESPEVHGVSIHKPVPNLTFDRLQVVEKRFDKRKSSLKNFCGTRWDPIMPKSLGYRSNIISKFGISKSNIPFFVCLAPKAGSTSLTTILLGFFDDGQRQSSNVSFFINYKQLDCSWN